jgi:hypothetical protein
MNIYALEGHKVRCTNLTGGYDHHQETAKKHLAVGQEYTVEYTDVGSWHTDVYLKEFPDVNFNSVFFEDVTEQPHDLSKEHHDYKYYND